MPSFCPPVSARDIIDVCPADERISAAKDALSKADAADETAVAAAQKAVDDAVSAKGDDAAVYRLRVPTGRSKAAAVRDVMAEAISIKSNEKLLEAILADEDLGDDERGFVIQVAEYLPKLGAIDPADWDHVRDLAGIVPAASKIIADRVYYANIYRLHILRHHIALASKRSPIHEVVIDAIPSEDQFALSNKLEEMMAPTKDAAKNSDAP